MTEVTDSVEGMEGRRSATARCSISETRSRSASSLDWYAAR
jgi:hypothetical protein